MKYGRSRKNMVLDVIIGLFVGAGIGLVVYIFSRQLMWPLIGGLAVFGLYQLWVLQHVTRGQVTQSQVIFKKGNKTIGAFLFDQFFFSYEMPDSQGNKSIYLIAEERATGERTRVDCTSFGKDNFFRLYRQIAQKADTMVLEG